ncbi:MAG: SDR family oxidoreductase [Mycobacterium sp.]
MRTIAVTGSASGIGAATAARLEADGCRVIRVDVQRGDVVGDLLTRAGRLGIVDEILSLSGGVLDGLVCAAGVRAFAPRYPGREGEIISINYFGTAELLQALRPALAAAPEPAVAIVASWGLFRPWPLPEAVQACIDGDEARAIEIVNADPRAETLHPAYSTSKAALAKLVRLTAPTPEWAGSNITLNVTVPSVTKTAMTTDRLSTQEGEAELLRAAPIPMGRIAEPEDQADLLAYFVGGRARYITGQVVCVDGGLEAQRRPDAAIQPIAEWTER